MSEKKSGYEMAGEFCREAAVLIFVFANLDLWLYQQYSDWNVIKHLLEACGVALLFFVAGYALEKWRRQ